MSPIGQNANFSLDFKGSNDFAASGIFLSNWHDSKSAGFTNSLSNYVASTVVPSNCAIYWQFRTSDSSTYSDASAWSSTVVGLTGRFIQLRGTLYKSDSATSGAVVSEMNVYSTPQGQGLMIEESTVNLLATPEAPVSGDITVSTGTVYSLSIWDSVNPTGVVTIAHKNVETLTADFSTGTLTGVTASGDALVLDTATADPTFTRATSATKYDGTTVASGAARYEDVIQQLLLTNNRDWNNGTLERVNSTPDGKLGVFITDDFDTVTSGFYTAYGAGNIVATFNTASGRLELSESGGPSNDYYIYKNHSMKNTAVEAVINQSNGGGLVLRYQDAGTMYWVWLYDDTVSASNNAYIYKRVSGSSTLLSGPINLTFTRGTNYTFRFEIVDSVLKLYQDGVLVGSVTDTSITTEGKVGFIQSSNGVSTNIHSFKIDDKTPIFARNSIAYNPQTGASVAANVPRYVKGKNLLTKNQSDVETNTTGFSNWAGSTSFSRYTTSAYAGSACLQVISDPATANSGVYAWSDRMPGLVPAGSTLTASVYLVGNSGTVQINCAIEYTDGTVTNNLGGTITVTPTWTRYSRSTAATAGKTISRVQIAVVTTTAQTMTWYMDSLQVEVGSTATTWQQGGGNAILIEEGTLNLLSSGAEGFVSGWSAFGGAVATITSGQVDPFGGTSAYRIQTTGGTSINKYYTSAGTSVNLTKYSESIWIKNAGLSTVAMHPNIAAGVYTANTDGWKLLKNEGMVGNGASTLSLYFQTAASGDVLDIYVMYPQLEAKAYCTSYITPAVTRANEQMSIPAFPTSSVSEGSITIRAYFSTDVITGTSVNTHNIFYAHNGSNNSIIRVVRAGNYLSARTSDSAGNTTDASWAAATISEGWHNVGMRWNSSRISLYFDGTEVASDTTSVVVPSSVPSIAEIGSITGTQQWNHAIDDVNFFSRYLSDAEMAAATTNS